MPWVDPFVYWNVGTIYTGSEPLSFRVILRGHGYPPRDFLRRLVYLGQQKEWI